MTRVGALLLQASIETHYQNVVLLFGGLVILFGVCSLNNMQQEVVAGLFRIYSIDFCLFLLHGDGFTVRGKMGIKGRGGYMPPPAFLVLIDTILKRARRADRFLINRTEL